VKGLLERPTSHKTESKPAPTPPSVPEGQILAKVNNQYLTVQDLKRRLDALEESVRPKTPEDKKQFLEQMIREELLVQDAAARGIERAPEVKNRLSDFRRFVLLDTLTKQLADAVTVEPADVEAYYNQYQAGFKDPERIHVRQIVSSTLEEAEAIRGRVVQGDDFAQLARERSVGAGKDQGGDVGWYLRAVDKQLIELTNKTSTDKTFFPQLESVAFTLEVRQISQPVKGPDGKFYLVKLEERQSAKQKSLSEVRSQIHDGLLFQKRQKTIEDLLTKLRQQGEVSEHPERLDQI
jgi:peptidyl-prolyl cis-trans isomerase C